MGVLEISFFFPLSNIKMKFQFYSCSLILNWRCPAGTIYKYNEVHVALHGRVVNNNETVTLTFRYCPYVVVADWVTAQQIRHTHCDVLQRKPLLGPSDVTVYRLHVPLKSEFDRVMKAYKSGDIKILDSHQTLEQQMRLVLGLKPLDLISVDCTPTTHKLTTTQQEYHIPVRLVAGTRGLFPLRVTKFSDFVQNQLS